MASREVHYEIFRRQGVRGSWSLHDLSNRRESAIELAEELMKSGRATGVKVVKETYDPDTGDYLSLRIFEEGLTKLKLQPAAEDLAHALPCFKPDDLYSYHARATLARVLRDYLARHKITVTELIHRADCLEKFEATGTTYQHAVQKVAVAQAASTSLPVQQIIKSLNELATKAIHRVYRDARRNYFPVAGAGEFAALADRLVTESDGPYLLNAALARYLAPCTNWSDKLSALLAAMAEAVPERPGGALLLESVDTLIAEVLAGSAAIHELIGASANLGQALTVLADLFLGESLRAGANREGLRALAAHFAAGRLGEARTAIAHRILAELRRPRRLCPASLNEELDTSRDLANRLVTADPRYLGNENLVAAFTIRSRRLVAPDALAQHLAEAATPDEKITLLLRIEENLVGAESKRQLGASLLHILASPPFEEHFVSGRAPVMTRLKRLTELQALAARSNLPDNQRQQIADVVERIASEVERRVGVLKALRDSLPGPVERALAFLTLCGNDMLPAGRVRNAAQEIVLSTIAQPGFLAHYLAKMRGAGRAEGRDPERAMAELLRLLESAGISRETGLNAIAA